MNDQAAKIYYKCVTDRHAVSINGDTQVEFAHICDKCMKLINEVDKPNEQN